MLHGEAVRRLPKYAVEPWAPPLRTCGPAARRARVVNPLVFRFRKLVRSGAAPASATRRPPGRVDAASPRRTRACRPGARRTRGPARAVPAPRSPTARRASLDPPSRCRPAPVALRRPADEQGRHPPLRRGARCRCSTTRWSTGHAPGAAQHPRARRQGAAQAPCAELLPLRSWTGPRSWLTVPLSPWFRGPLRELLADTLLSPRASRAATSTPCCAATWTTTSPGAATAAASCPDAQSCGTGSGCAPSGPPRGRPPRLAAGAPAWAPTRSPRGRPRGARRLVRARSPRRRGLRYVRASAHCALPAARRGRSSPSAPRACPLVGWRTAPRSAAALPQGGRSAALLGARSYSRRQHRPGRCSRRRARWLARAARPEAPTRPSRRTTSTSRWCSSWPPTPDVEGVRREAEHPGARGRGGQLRAARERHHLRVLLEQHARPRHADAT